MRRFYDSNTWPKVRQQVITRDGNKCQHCGSMQNLQVHYIVPIGKGGTDDPLNLLTLCASCHAKVEPKEQAGEMAVKLKCPRESCGHVWTYNGKSVFVTSCPKCKTSVTIDKNTVKEVEKK